MQYSTRLKDLLPLTRRRFSSTHPDLQSQHKRVLLAQAVRVLEHRAAFKTRTVGKRREALALDFNEPCEAWYALSH